jgi:hypothetical protein
MSLGALAVLAFAGAQVVGSLSSATVKPSFESRLVREGPPPSGPCAASVKSKWGASDSESSVAFLNCGTRATPGARSAPGTEMENSRTISSFCPIAQAESPAISLVPAYLRSFAGVSFRRKLCPTNTSPNPASSTASAI